MSTLSNTLLAADEGGNRALTGSLFIVIVLITVGITFWASRNNRTASDYYAGGRSFTGAQNGFAVAGDDKKFVWADAAIDGDSVVVSSSAVAKPVAVRYAFGNNRTWANLFNKDGLPAVTFRTDSW